MNSVLSRKSFLIPAAVFLAVLLISIISFLMSGTRSEKRVLFFPDDMSRDVRNIIKGETRYLPVYDSLEKNMELLVRELLLGPEHLMYERAVPEKTRLNTLILNGDELYLDFSIDIAISDPESILIFDDVINLIKKTVTFNFKNVRTVNITVDGQIPGSSYYSGRSDN